MCASALYSPLEHLLGSAEMIVLSLFVRRTADGGHARMLFTAKPYEEIHIFIVQKWLRYVYFTKTVGGGKILNVKLACEIYSKIAAGCSNCRGVKIYEYKTRLIKT